jgi:MSHA pilin protein MshC
VQHGFTLIELIIVIVLVGILSAVAGPRFFDRSGFDERGFYDEVFAALRHARTLAVASGCVVRVSIAANSYTLNQRTACTSGGFTQPVFHPGQGEPGYTATAPSGVTLSSTVAVLDFDAGGAASTGATVTIATRTLTVEQDTGFVHGP